MRFTRRAPAITLNGIAQGYATDRVVDTLRTPGLSTTLVNMGEIRAIGARPDGTPWRVGLADPDEPGAVTETVDLVDRAVATTAGAGFRFDAFWPLHASVRSRNGTQPVALPHGQRRRADSDGSGCLSTAFSLMPLSRSRDVVSARQGVQARVLTSEGKLFVYDS